jgi:hypothetical protein
MEDVVKIVEVLSPAIQVLCGGLIAMLGSILVQSRTYSSDKRKFYREAIQECYRLIIDINDANIDLNVALRKKLRGGEHEAYWASESHQHSRFVDNCIKELELKVSLYLPELLSDFMTYGQVIIDKSDTVAEAMSKTSELTEEEYVSRVEPIDNELNDKAHELRHGLEKAIDKNNF